jgi:hypothetical protein
MKWLTSLWRRLVRSSTAAKIKPGRALDITTQNDNVRSFRPQKISSHFPFPRWRRSFRGDVHRITLKRDRHHLRPLVEALGAWPLVIVRRITSASD